MPSLKSGSRPLCASQGLPAEVFANLRDVESSTTACGPRERHEAVPGPELQRLGSHPQLTRSGAQLQRLRGQRSRQGVRRQRPENRAGRCRGWLVSVSPRQEVHKCSQRLAVSARRSAGCGRHLPGATDCTSPTTTSAARVSSERVMSSSAATATARVVMPSLDPSRAVRSAYASEFTSPVSASVGACPRRCGLRASSSGTALRASGAGPVRWSSRQHQRQSPLSPEAGRPGLTRPQSHGHACTTLPPTPLMPHASPLPRQRTAEGRAVIARRRRAAFLAGVDRSHAADRAGVSPTPAASTRRRRGRLCGFRLAAR